jgi:hypothetical protein
MGSRAFVAVARFVLFIARDPNDDRVRLLAQAKNNVGRSDDLPLLPFRIVPFVFHNADGDEIETAQIEWLMPDSSRSLTDIVRSGGQDKRDPRRRAEQWLTTFLTGQPDRQASWSDIRAAADQAGHNYRTVQRAANDLGVKVTPRGRHSTWQLPADDTNEPRSETELPY